MKYEVPVLKIVYFEDEDVIRTSTSPSPSLGGDGKTEDLPDMFA